MVSPLKTFLGNLGDTLDSSLKTAQNLLESTQKQQTLPEPNMSIGTSNYEEEIKTEMEKYTVEGLKQIGRFFLTAEPLKAIGKISWMIPEKRFNALPNINAFRRFWPEGGVFESDPFRFDYSHVDDKDVSRKFSSATIHKVAAEIMHTDRKRYEAIEEYFSLNRELSTLFGNDEAMFKADIKEIEAKLDRIENLVRKADLQDLYIRLSMETEGMIWEYRGSKLKNILDIMVFAHEELDRIAAADLLGKADGDEDDDLLNLLNILEDIPKITKESLPLESDLSTGPLRKEMERALEETRKIKSETGYTEELNRLYIEFKSNSISRQQLIGRLTNILWSLTAKMKLPARIVLYLGRLEEEASHIGLTKNSNEYVKGIALEETILDSETPAPDVSAAGRFANFVDTYEKKFSTIADDKAKSRLANPTNISRISAQLINESTKLHSMIEKELKEGITPERFNDIFLNIGSNYQALLQTLEAVKNQVGRYDDNRLKEITDISVGSILTSISTEKRIDILKAIIDEDIAYIMSFYMDVLSGKENFQNADISKIKELLTRLFHINTVIGNQATVLFKHGISEVNACKLYDKWENDALKKDSPRERRLGPAFPKKGDLYLTDEFGNNTCKDVKRLDEILDEPDIIKLSVDGGATVLEELRTRVKDLLAGAKAELPTDQEKVAGEIAADYTYNERIEQVRKTLSAEREFLKNSHDISREASEYLLAFGSVDLEKVWNTNEYKSLPHWKDADKKIAEFERRFKEIKIGYNEEALAVLTKELNEYMRSHGRNELGYLIGENKEYLEFRSKVRLVESVIQTGLSGWAGTGVASWVLNWLKYASTAKEMTRFSLLALQLLKTNKRAMALSTLFNSPVFHTLLRLSGHDPTKSIGGELVGYLHTFFTLLLIGSINARVTASQGDYLKSMARSILGRRCRTLGKDIASITEEEVLNLSNSIAKNPLVMLALNTHSYGAEVVGFQGLNTVWAAGENAYDKLLGSGVAEGAEWWRYIFSTDAWLENAAFLLGLRFMHPARNLYGKGRQPYLRRQLAKSLNKIQEAQKALNNAIEGLETTTDEQLAWQRVSVGRKELESLSRRHNALLGRLPPKEQGKWLNKTIEVSKNSYSDNGIWNKLSKSFGQQNERLNNFKKKWFDLAEKHDKIVDELKQLHDQFTAENKTLTDEDEVKMLKLTNAVNEIREEMLALVKNQETISPNADAEFRKTCEDMLAYMKKWPGLFGEVKIVSTEFILEHHIKTMDEISRNIRALKGQDIEEPTALTEKSASGDAKGLVGSAMPEAMPEGKRADELNSLAVRGIEDVFPELDIRPDMAEKEILSTFTSFLKAYREAERLLYSNNTTHCGESARLIIHLLVAKGFTAFDFYVYRFVSHDKEKDIRYGQLISEIAKKTGVSAGTVRYVLLGFKKGNSVSDIVKEIDQGHQPGITRLSKEEADKIHKEYSSLSPEERDLFIYGREFGHRVAAIKIGNRYYIIDINQQQLGKEYDELVFLPEEEATKAGIIPYSKVEDAEKSQSHRENHLDLPAINLTNNTRNKTIRESMKTEGYNFGGTSKLTLSGKDVANVVKITGPPNLEGNYGAVFPDISELLSGVGRLERESFLQMAREFTGIRADNFNKWWDFTDPLKNAVKAVVEKAKELCPAIREIKDTKTQAIAAVRYMVLEKLAAGKSFDFIVKLEELFPEGIDGYSIESIKKLIEGELLILKGKKAAPAEMNLTQENEWLIPLIEIARKTNAPKRQNDPSDDMLITIVGSTVSVSAKDKKGILIGSDDDCTISLDDKEVSGKHVKIQRDGNQYSIHEYNKKDIIWLKRNGSTRLIRDGEILHDGDIIRIGKKDLKLQIPESPAIIPDNGGPENKELPPKYDTHNSGIDPFKLFDMMRGLEVDTASLKSFYDLVQEVTNVDYRKFLKLTTTEMLQLACNNLLSSTKDVKEITGIVDKTERVIAALRYLALKRHVGAPDKFFAELREFYGEDIDGNKIDEIEQTVKKGWYVTTVSKLKNLKLLPQNTWLKDLLKKVSFKIKHEIDESENHDAVLITLPPSVTFGERTFFLEKPFIIIGRDKGSDINLSDPSVSHQHAKIYNDGSDYYIKDLRRGAGTYLGRDGIFIRIGGLPAKLKSGDVVKIGKTELTFNDSPVKEPKKATPNDRPSNHTIFMEGPQTSFFKVLGKKPQDYNDDVFIFRVALLNSLRHNVPDEQWKVMAREISSRPELKEILDSVIKRAKDEVKYFAESADMDGLEMSCAKLKEFGEVLKKLGFQELTEKLMSEFNQMLAYEGFVYDNKTKTFQACEPQKFRESNLGKTLKDILDYYLSRQKEANEELLSDKSQRELYDGANLATIALGAERPENGYREMEFPDPLKSVKGPLGVHGYHGYFPKEADYHGEIDGRFYIVFNEGEFSRLAYDAVEKLMKVMTEGPAKGKFWFKVYPTEKGNIKRDHLIVYFNSADEVVVLNALSEFQKSFGSSDFNEKGPYFTARIANGLFFGDQPLNHDYSFGSLRANALKEAWDRIRLYEKLKGMPLDIETKRQIIAYYFAKAGIDTENPAFNKGSESKFPEIRKVINNFNSGNGKPPIQVKIFSGKSQTSDKKAAKTTNDPQGTGRTEEFSGMDPEVVEEFMRALGRWAPTVKDRIIKGIKELLGLNALESFQLPPTHGGDEVRLPTAETAESGDGQAAASIKVLRDAGALAVPLNKGQKREILDDLLKNYSKYAKEIRKNFDAAIEAVDKTDWSFEEKRDFLKLIAEKAVQITVYSPLFSCAFENLVFVTTEMNKMDWSYEDKKDFLALIAEKYGGSKELGTLIINALNKINRSYKNKRDLVVLISEKAGINAHIVFRRFDVVIEALNKTDWSDEKKCNLLALIVEKTGKIIRSASMAFADDNIKKMQNNVDSALRNLNTAIDAVNKTEWNSRDKLDFLTQIIEKVGENVGEVFSKLDTAIEAVKNINGSCEEKVKVVLIEIVKTTALKNLWYVSKLIREYDIKDRAALIEIAKIMIINDPDLDAIDEIVKEFGLELPSFNGPENYLKEDVLEWAKSLLKKLGLDEKMADALYSDMEKRDVGLALLFEMLHLAETDKAGLLEAAAKGEIHLSRYLMANLFGLDVDLLMNMKFSKRAIGNFYEHCLVIQSGLVSPAFRGMRFSPELFGKDSLPLLNFIHGLNNLKGLVTAAKEINSDALTGIDENIVKAATDGKANLLNVVLRQQFQNLDITPSNIGDISAKMDEVFQDLFRDVFKIGDQTVTVEQINALESRWGNLEVFFTLAARFAGSDRWQDEIPVLGRVVATVLKDRFHSFKYDGFEGDDHDIEAAGDQLAMLKGEETVKGWKANYSKIGVYRSGTETGTKSEAELFKQSKAILQGQVMGHVNTVSLSDSGREEVGRIKEELRMQDTKETVKTHAKKPALLHAMFELLSEFEDAGQYSKMVGFMRANSAAIGLNAQLIADVAALSDAMRYKVKAKDAIVFTTTADDPKLLLMTGDLADTSSCQNYRTGSHIETLLGYVIDANVKLILSYALSERDFASKAEYDRAKDLVEKGVRAVFEPALQKLRIGDIEVDLPKAYVRRVIKLGEAKKGGAGLVMENPYYQNHPAEGMMKSHIEAVFGELARQSGAKTGEPITIPATRNPGGVYSDASGGIKTEPYEITP